MVMSVQKETVNDITIQPMLLTIPQVMVCLSLGRNKVYDLIQKEGLPVMRFGRAVRVPRTGLQQWLDQRGQSDLEF